MRTLLYLTIASFLFTGCKKNNETESLVLSGKFVPDVVTHYDKPVMYVQNQVINDTGIINPYLRSKNQAQIFVFTPTAPTPTGFWSF